MSPNNTKEKGRLRLTVTVTGAVQGVGYRYYVRDTANGLGVNGYVRNLPDGSVEVVVEGTREQLEKLREQIEIDKEPIHVKQVKTSFGRPKGLKGFKVRDAIHVASSIILGADKLITSDLDMANKTNQLVIKAKEAGLNLDNVVCAGYQIS